MKRKLPFALILAISAVGFIHADVDSTKNSDVFVLETVQPSYPERMQQRGESGQVLVKVIVAETGELAEAKVVSSSHPDFGVAALKAVKSWEFEAAVKDGFSVPQVVVVPVRFQFGEDAQNKSDWIVSN